MTYRPRRATGAHFPVAGNCALLSALPQKREILHSTRAVHALRDNELHPELLLRFLSRGLAGASDVRHLVPDHGREGVIVDARALQRGLQRDPLAKKVTPLP